MDLWFVQLISAFAVLLSLRYCFIAARAMVTPAPVVSTASERVRVGVVKERFEEYERQGLTPYEAAAQELLVFEEYENELTRKGW